MNIPVEEFTSLSPITIGLNADLEKAHKLMRKHEIRHLPVIEDSNVIGILSDKDLFANYGKPWSEQLRVKEIMNNSILSVYVNDSLGEVAYRLSKEKKDSAIVLDMDNKLYGIFTTIDALNALVEILSPEAHAKSMLGDI